MVAPAPAARKWRRRRASAATGHRVGCPLRPCPSVLPRVPFFRVVNMNVTNVVDPDTNVLDTEEVVGGTDRDTAVLAGPEEEERGQKKKPVLAGPEEEEIGQ